MKKDDQVMVRRRLRNGTLVRIGSILTIDAEAGVATVHFPVEGTQQRFPIEELEPTADRFSGRARVPLNPVMRKS